jgi:hypothetical protein
VATATGPADPGKPEAPKPADTDKPASAETAEPADK